MKRTTKNVMNYLTTQQQKHAMQRLPYFEQNTERTLEQVKKHIDSLYTLNYILIALIMSMTAVIVVAWIMN